MKRLLSFLAALMLMGATPLAVSATAKAEMNIIKSEQFTSTDKNELYDLRKVLHRTVMSITLFQIQHQS